VPSVRHKGTITLGSVALDLDALSSDPQRTARAGSSDIQQPSPTGPIYLNNDAMKLTLGSVAASYQSCSTTTGYDEHSMHPRDMSVGEYYCILTGDKRYVCPQILQVNANALILDVESYDPPAE
jgi:hypothetical protein